MIEFNLQKKEKLTIKNKSYGFTLAEVLITLGIIGIIAELTIPTIMQSIQNIKASVTAKVAYSDLSQALTHYLSENSNVLGVETTNGMWEDHNALADKFADQMKVVKRGSGYQILGASGAIKYKYYKGISSNWPPSSESGNNAFVLANGMIYEFVDEGGSGYTHAFNDYCEIWVDTNGNKQPNMAGVDFLSFYIIKVNSSYSIIPAGTPGDKQSTCIVDGDTLPKGLGCTYFRLYDPDNLP